MKKVILLSVIISLICCVSCGKSDETQSAEEEVVVNNCFSSSVGPEGVLSYEQRILIYQDTANGKHTPLCTKANCEHHSASDCTACYDDSLTSDMAAFFYKGKLYVLVNGAVGASTLYQADPDGKNRKELLQLDVCVNDATKMIIKDNQIYALVVKENIDEKNGNIDEIPLLIVIQIDDPSFKVLEKPMSGYQAHIQLEHVSEGKVYYSKSYWDRKKKVVDVLSKDGEDEKIKSLAKKYFHQTVCEVNTDTGEKTESEITLSYDESLLAIRSDGIYISDAKENILWINLNTKERKTIWENDAGKIVYSSGFEDFYLMAEEKEGSFLYHKIDYQTGKETTFSRKRRIIYRFVSGGKLYYPEWNEAGTAIQVGQDKETNG